MNYRHAYHAGNFADVLKHAVLARIIEHLKLKPQPFRVIDTHAGAGRYDIEGVESSKTGEWRDGIGRLMQAPFPAEVAQFFAPYLGTVQALNTSGPLRFYPGSPLIARALLRKGDALIVNELHDEDRDTLKSVLLNAPDTKVLGLDGWTALKSLLPPKERRGLIVIDPPFEVTGEFERMGDAVLDAQTRFANAIYLIWYPLKDERAALRFVSRVTASQNVKALDARLWISAPGAEPGLCASGILVLNPPYKLKEGLETALPFLASTLSRGPGAGFKINAWGE